MDREIYYNSDPEHDNDLCWGIDRCKCEAKYAPQFACSHDDCQWDFYQGFTGLKKSGFFEHIVGYARNMLTIRCPICQRYLWVHCHGYKTDKTKEVPLLDVYKKYCKVWPR